MATVRAECPGCGDVELQVQDLVVRECLDDDVPGAYRFRCPVCEQTVSRDASARIVDLLVFAGAGHEWWCRPAELAERPTGPALTLDDLLDLHVLLAGDGWFDDLVALVSRTTPE